MGDRHEPSNHVIIIARKHCARAARVMQQSNIRKQLPA